MHTWPFWLTAALLAAGAVLWRIYEGSTNRPSEASTDDFLILGFEATVIDLLESRGFTATRAEVRGSLVASKEARAVLVQMEYQRTRVGLGSLRRALAASASLRCDGAMVVTNSSFSRTASSFARRHGVELLDGRGLLSQFAQIEPPAFQTATDRTLVA